MSVTVTDVKGARSASRRSVKVDYAPSGYVAVEPFRLLDTRTAHTPLRGGEPLAVQLPAGTAVPGHEPSSGMTAAPLNVTVTDSTQEAHLTVWPAGQPRPASSNVLGEPLQDPLGDQQLLPLRLNFLKLLAQLLGECV
ncbi:hypothetical protein [Streptomyces sp. NPDC059761]|uniref:hypothetical protein n=1 Tax=Streptomyces sp. NPDC059761 TaxID=3346937 RepID=UPI00365C2086